MTETSESRSSLNVEELNDRLAREHPIDDYYERSIFLIRWVERRRLEIIKRMVGPSRGLKILEVGSGGGHILRQFRDAKLTAVDVSDVFLDTARKNLRGYDCEFIKGQVEDLGLPEASFDRIICSEVLEHTEDPARILEEIARLLKPNGTAVITVPNDPLIMRVKWILRHTPVGWLLRNRIEWGGDPYHLHRWKPRQFRRLLEPCFRVQEQAAAPLDRLPLRVCFACVKR